MLAGSVGNPCRVSSRSSSLGLKGCFEFACLFSRPFCFGWVTRCNDAFTGPLIWTGLMFNDSLTDGALKGGLEFNRPPSRPFASKWGFWTRWYF